jgi:hypothetical protein
MLARRFGPIVRTLQTLLLERRPAWSVRRSRSSFAAPNRFGSAIEVRDHDIERASALNDTSLRESFNALHWKKIIERPAHCCEALKFDDARPAR